MEQLFDQHSSSDIIFILDDFEGPIELLVHLCKINGLDVHTVKISAITDQFLKYIEGIEDSEMDLDKITDFLVMAATLLEIKAKAALPIEEVEVEEEDALDTEEELRRRMIEHEMFKEKAEEIKESETRNRFYREPEYSENDARVSIVGFNLDKLMQAYAKVMYRFSHEEETPGVKTIDRDEHTVADKLDSLVKKLLDVRKIDFFELFDEAHSKNEVITTFLALLQLVGKQFAIIEQESNFSNIHIALNEEFDPEKYDYSVLAMSEDND